MRSVNLFGIFILAAALLASVFVSDASAQRRRTLRSSSIAASRPIFIRQYVIRRDPFWYDRYRWGWGDPFGYDPYFYDPYLPERRERYFREKSVRDARRKIAKNRAKFTRDGYLSAKEREKLAKNYKKYSKAVRKLNRFNQDY